MDSLGYAEVAIKVEDVERSVRFYIDVVGYEISQYDIGPDHRILKVGPDNLLGIHKLGVMPEKVILGGVYGHFHQRNIGQVHLVFAIAQHEVEPLADRLVEAGYEIHGPETHNESGELHLYASDPDGHAMEWWGKI